MAELRRVVAIAEEVPLRDGRTTWLTAVELWDFGIVLRHASDRSSHVLKEGTALPEHDPRASIEWHVDDNLGTTYQWFGGGSGGSDRGEFGYSMFIPPVPTNVGKLLIFAPLMHRERPIAVQLIESN